MKAGVVLSGVIAVAATVGLATVFVSNASPYMKVAELKDSNREVHVVGQIVPGSLSQDAMGKRVSFKIQDPTGQIPVLYTGPPQPNLSTATQVVVIGAMHSGQLDSEKLLVKCPSKYESKTGPNPHENNATAS